MSAEAAGDRRDGATPGADDNGDSLGKGASTTSNDNARVVVEEDGTASAADKAASAPGSDAMMASINTNGAAEEESKGSKSKMTGANANDVSAESRKLAFDATQEISQASSPAQLPTSDSGEPPRRGSGETPGDNQSGLYTFSDDMKVEMSFGWVPMLVGLMPDTTSPNNYKAQIGAKVNHGVKQAPSMVDIINNMIGNKAGIDGRPRPSMSNDMPMYRVLGMELADNEDRKCTVNLVASVSSDATNEWKEYRGRYFCKRDKEGRNPLEQRLNKRKGAYKMDPFDTTNHEKILALYPGANVHYKTATDAASQKAEESGRQFDELDAYRALVWAISVWKLEALYEDDEENGESEIIELINIKEGNHRAGAGFIMLFNAAYEPSDGRIVCDTLSKDWFVKQLVAYEVEKRKLDVIEAAYEKVDIRAEVLKLVKDAQSCLRRENMSVVLYFGRTEDVFLEHDVDMDYIQSLDILFSRTVADDKQRSVEPTENTTIAKNIKAILDLMEKNEAKLGKGETVNFSANASVNGELYVGYERAAKKGSTLPPCELFASKQWQNLVRRPSPETIREYCHSIKIGSVKLGKPLEPPQGKPSKPSGKMVPQPTGKVYNMPFALNQNNMFGLLGKEGTGKPKKDKDEPAQGDTYAARRMDEGYSSLPITMSEHLKAMIVAVVAPSAMRATTNTRRYAWSRFTQRNLCELAVQYIVESQNFEVYANRWGNKVTGKSWDKKEWKKHFGNGQVLKPENVYVAFSCMIADLVVSCFGNYSSDGLKRARAFADMLATAHDDAKEYSDMSMVTNLGLLYIRLRHYAELVTDKIKADANIRTGATAKVNAGFLYWNVQNGIMASLAKVLTIYGIDPVPSLEDNVTPYMDQFVTMYKSMEAREGTQAPPSEEEKGLYRHLFKHAQLELNTFSKPTGETKAIRKIINSVGTSMRQSGLEDPGKNLGNNQSTLRSKMGILGLFITFFVANTCYKHITYKEDEEERAKQAPLMKKQYVPPTSMADTSRNVMIAFQGNEATKSWSVEGFEMPGGMHTGEPRSMLDYAMFVFGANVRQSCPDKERQKRKEEAMGFRAMIQIVNENKEATKFTMDLPVCTIETSVAKAASPAKKTDAKQEALDNCQNHLGILHRMYREGRRIKDDGVKAHAFDEFLDYMRLNSVSILSGRGLTSEIGLTPRKKKAMNEDERAKHFRGYDLSCQKQLRNFQETRRTMEPAMEPNISDDSDMEINEKEEEEDINGEGEEETEVSAGEEEQRWPAPQVKSYLQAKLPDGHFAATEEGFRVLGGKVGKKILKWFKGDMDDDLFGSDEDKAKMNQIASQWTVETVTTKNYKLTEKNEIERAPETSTNSCGKEDQPGPESSNEKKRKHDGEQQDDDNNDENKELTPKKKRKNQSEGDFKETGEDDKKPENSTQRNQTPKRQKKRKQNVPPAVAKKKLTDINSMIITKLKVGNTIQRGSWNLLKDEEVDAAGTIIKTKKATREDKLFEILNHMGGPEDIKKMWEEYFDNEDPAFAHLKKWDRINDLIDYIIGK